MTALHRADIAALLRPSDATPKTLSTELVARTSSAHTVGESGKLKQASRDFETVFLRQMLAALERTTKVGDKGPNVAGQQAYGSMIVEAVADAVAQAGGIGLGSLLEKALADRSEGPRPNPNAMAPAAALQSAAIGANIREAAALAGASTDFARISPQGLSSNAVPKNEIQKPAAEITVQRAAPRIR